MNMRLSVHNTSVFVRVFFLIVIISIVGVLWHLNQNMMVTIKARGGTITEGIIGAPRFINPVLAQSQADIDLTRLVFTPILSIDRTGEVTYKLAEHIDTSPDGLTYTLHLKQGLYFEDGEVLNADDVVFTVTSIQDSLIKSPLATKWQGVEVEKIDTYTVLFKLARPFSDFLYNLELGVLPEHIWSNIDPQEFIFSNYNSHPVGSGPYTVRHITTKETGVPSEYVLERSSETSEEAYITKIVLTFFDNEADLMRALVRGDIDAAYGVSASSIVDMDPERIYSATLPRVFALFFNQESQPLLKSLRVRQAINYAIDKQAIVDEIFAGYASPVSSPFGFARTEHEFDSERARTLLEADGWDTNDQGVYTKRINKEPVTLQFDISIPNTDEMKLVAEHVQNDLAAVGISTTIRSYDQGNFNQNILRPREYEAVIFGYEIEKPSDMYAFWHSSQISDPGLNISLFNNSNVDTLLSNLRASKNPDLTNIDDAIIQEQPAVFLYSPSYIYILPTKVHGSSFSIARSSDRFDTIQDWYIRTRNVWKMFTTDS
ncbi:peptide ABC transporter substrate-binding protein [Patescibacteria group bacterium]|nr:peptide ABC transporter substrate-binding protein [Patescibacteria group bacterium]